MGKASSNKKVARAAKAAGRPGAKKSYAWPLTIGAVVVLGVVLIVVTVAGPNKADTPPTLSDHWHEAYGVYDCDRYLPSLPEAVASGIHTHGDGLIHVEPSSTAETGKNANIATFVRGYSGLSVSQSEIKLPSGQAFKDGGKCGAKRASVKLFVWSKVTDAKPRQVTSATDKILIENNAAIAFAFVPDGVTPPLPPSVTALANPNAGEGGGSSPSTPSPAATTPSTSAPPSTAPSTSAP